jgi:hypothetical protein
MPLPRHHLGCQCNGTIPVVRFWGIPRRWSGAACNLLLSLRCQREVVKHCLCVLAARSSCHAACAYSLRLRTCGRYRFARGRWLHRRTKLRALRNLPDQRNEPSLLSGVHVLSVSHLVLPNSHSTKTNSVDFPSCVSACKPLSHVAITLPAVRLPYKSRVSSAARTSVACRARFCCPSQSASVISDSPVETSASVVAGVGVWRTGPGPRHSSSMGPHTATSLTRMSLSSSSNSSSL